MTVDYMTLNELGPARGLDILKNTVIFNSVSPSVLLLIDKGVPGQ